MVIHGNRCWLAALALAVAAFDVHADTKLPLFEVISDAMPAPGAGAIAEHLVILDAAALRNATVLAINIPGYPKMVEREQFESRPGGGYLWYGRIDGMNDVLITSDGTLANIHVGGTDGRWTVRPLGGSHLLTKIDPDYVIPPDEVAEPPAPKPPLEPIKSNSKLQSETRLALPEANESGQGDIAYIDIMVLYTAEALEAAEGHAQIRNQAQHQIDLNNQIFADSLVQNVRYRLRHASFSAITDGLSAIGMLDALRLRPGLSQMRNAYGADTVILLNGYYSDFIAGIAFAQRNPGAAFAPNALASVTVNFTYGSYIFMHEGGHILGMEHHPDDPGAATPQQASFPWSFGHRTPLASPAPPEPGFITIMSYFGNGGSCGTPCSRIPYFSNPEIALGPPYSGLAAGIPDQRDNARTARLIGPGNSQFYTETDVIFLGDLEYMP
jgi:hypothetical protein